MKTARNIGTSSLNKGIWFVDDAEKVVNNVYTLGGGKASIYIVYIRSKLLAMIKGSYQCYDPW